MFLRLASLLIFVWCMATPVSATIIVLPQNQNLDLDSPPDGLADLRGLVCNCPLATSLRHQNGSARASSSNTWANTTLSYAQTLSYSQTGDFIPSEDGSDIYVIRTSNQAFVRLRGAGTNSASGITIEYIYLGGGVPPAPTANFTFSSVDLIASFQDTSTGAASWSWNFGDSGTSTQQNPQHTYASASSYNVCLTATNLGGSNQICKAVPVSMVPSTTIAAGASVDFDTDGLMDMQVIATGDCGGAPPNKFHPLNNARSVLTASDYRTLTLFDVLNLPTFTSDFCQPAEDILAAAVMRTGRGSWVKLWSPRNSAGSVRIQYEVLISTLIFLDGFQGNGGPTTAP